MPLVDILMPVRNAAPFLGAAVHSLGRQSLREWRLIAVDDGSTDGSWDLLIELAGRDGRILPLRSQGRGIVAALNRALEESSAAFLARMDADDLSAPRRLSCLIDIMSDQPGTGVAGSRVRLFPRSALTSNMERYLTWQNSLITGQDMYRERYVESTMTHATALFRRETLKDAGGWREGTFPEDLDLWLRLHRSGVRFAKHQEVLYLWRDHPGRETRTSPRCTPAAFHRCRAAHLAAELGDAGRRTVAVLGPLRARERWTRSLQSEGFKVLSLSWKGDSPVPPQAENCDVTLAVFGVPGLRRRAREYLTRSGTEGVDYLFVG